MKDLHARCASHLAEVLKASTKASAQAREDAKLASGMLLATPDAEPRTVGQLLEDALSDAKNEIAIAQDRIDELKEQPFIKRVWLGRAAKKAKTDAELAYESKRRIEAGSVAAHKREVESAQRELTHDTHTKCKEALREAQDRLRLCEREERALSKICKPLIDALIRKGWLAQNTESLLKLSAEYAQKNNFSAAAEVIDKIEFQRIPSEDQIRKWVLEYQKVLDGMRRKSAGFAATAAYPGLMNPSLALAKVRFDATAWANSIDIYEDTPDRWHAVPTCMVNQGALADPVQWVIYWAFLRGCQEFAESASPANINEDVLTGMLMQALKGMLGDATKDRLLQLGYPRAKANLNFLHLAGKKGEHSTGADIGLVVLLDVGDLQMHKVALIQAKVSIDGNANIGSTPSGTPGRTQLQKLQDAERDFFVFYHRTDSGSPSPLPSVTSVEQLVKSGNLSKSDLAKERIVAKPREQGWDLATFIAFGLCTPTNSIGKDVPDGADPLDAITTGGSQSLPQYMIVVSLSHDEPGYHRVMSPLQRAGYRSIEPRHKGQALQISQAKELAYKGHEFGD